MSDSKTDWDAAHQRIHKNQTVAELRKTHKISEPARITLKRALLDPQIKAEEYEALERRALLGLSISLPDTSGRQLSINFH